VAQAFESYANKLRIDPDTKKKKFAVVQAEDELAAIGMVIGAAWNGARAFTATSGPGVSLMSEFLGLAYYAEIPAVLVNVQRGGPSTGMPTRTQQADIISSLYASHGDTKHPLLFPANPAECFELTATALDMADRLQTPIMVMSDLDLGMNVHMSPPLTWKSGRTYDRGKVYTAEDLDDIKTFGRYLDVDGDGICYRTLPGTHPTKGSFFTRGTSRDEYARYSESGETYVRVVDRINKKWETAKKLLPQPEIFPGTGDSKSAVLFFGTTTYAAMEAMDILRDADWPVAGIRIRSVPMPDSVREFIMAHEQVFVIEQNRDAQFRSVLINELQIPPQQLVSILNYDGQPITADHIVKQIQQHVLFQTNFSTSGVTEK
jgi:2-oxoglutarate ferredoxin oxidoreductase subunit alpha